MLNFSKMTTYTFLQNSAGLFASLQEQKQSPASVARRQSLHEQRPTPGFIGKMWHK